MSDKLTPRQARFVQEYLADLNATQAAIRAGYSAKTAEQLGYQLLQKPSVAAAIAAGQQARSERTEITADRVLTELAKLGFANMADYMRPGLGGPYLDFSALSRDQAAALQEVTVDTYIDGHGEDAREVKRVKFKLADKRAALVDIGRHLGMFKDRVEHTGKDGEKLIPAETDSSRIALAVLHVIENARAAAPGGAQQGKDDKSGPQ